MTETGVSALNCTVLLNQTNQRILGRCMEREHTLSELVEVLHLEMNEVHYRVQQLVRAGILQVSRQEKRSGRAIKFYRPTQPAFFLPFSETPYMTVVEFMAQQLHPITRRYLELVFKNAPVKGEWGLNFRLNEEGEGMAIMFGQKGGSLPEGTSLQDHLMEHRILGMWDVLELFPEDAREMQRELMKVHEKYRARQSPAGDKHLVGLFLVKGDLYSED